jgi:formate hydrogenlyase subunit 3/multisubunit Na+/H+ antiporter MnhD subunit
LDWNFALETTLLINIVIFSVVAALLASLVALGAYRFSWLLRYLAFLLLGLSGISAVVSGGWVLLNDITISAQLPLGLPWLKWHLHLDSLSSFFLIIVGLLTIAISSYGPSYVREFETGPYSLSTLGFFTGLFVAGLLLVLLADDAFSFMIAWEIMSLASYFLVGYQYLQVIHRRAALLYLLMAQLGAVAILLAFSILISSHGDFTFAAMRQAELSPLWAHIAFGLGLLGFGMKAGLVPLHVWLPEAHPVAPSPISALMSGVMLKVAIYGLIRLVFDLLGTLHGGWGMVLLIIGSGTALIGILFALMQNNLKRLLAYSSIENMGVITIGLGLSILFIANGYPFLGTLGMIAALYHTLNHALFKGLLFLSAGSILRATHEQNVENLGGLIRYLPYTAIFFLIGCLAISGLPPLNGFVSEWLTFQTALQTPSLTSGVLRAIIPLSAALLALTAALSAACFVKVYGVTFLGQPRYQSIHSVREPAGGMIVAQAFLALLCLLSGIFPTTIIDVLEIIPQHLVGYGLPSASEQGWLWLTPISAKVSSYSAPLVLLAIISVWIIFFLLLYTVKKTRRTAPWECGFGSVNPRMQYTATAFAMPLQRIFKPVWRVEELVKESTDNKTLYPQAIRYERHIADRWWLLLYEPLMNSVATIAKQIGRIQTGNIRTYLAYSFFTLLILLWLITY